MKRSGPLRRLSPLRSRTPLQPAARPLRLAPLPRRRPVVSAEERTARRLVAERSQGRCEGCGRAPATEWAHRVGRGQLGPWCPSNGLHLCSSGRPDSVWGGGLGCHEWSGKAENRVEAESIGWMLRRHHDPATRPVLLHGHGWVRLSPGGFYLPAEKDTA